MTDTLVVTFPQEAKGRPFIADALQGAADVVYLADIDDDRTRTSVLREATALLARNTAKELRPHEPALLDRAKLIQFINAGVDFVPLNVFPPQIPIASNGGAYAEPMAEHALAMVLAAAKRLIPEHEALKRGEFNQGRRNRSLAGGVCGILGFGGIGVATARLMRALGMKVHAINRRGASDEPTDWIGTPADLDTMLAACDVLVISTPLTPTTKNWIGARELGLMKPGAILANLARGEIVDEAALFAHLQANPKFVACIDAWWIEPVRHGTFRMDFPFLALPNVIGSPHNSASVPGTGETGLRRAVANIRRALAGETPLFLVGADERMM
ncbi:MAG: 2-hydroxyacid dehydrogenase [Rhodospirillales bacterium]